METKVTTERGPHGGCTCGINGWRAQGPDHAETCALWATSTTAPKGWCLWCSTPLKTHKPTYQCHYGEDDGRPSDGHPLHTPERCRDVLAKLREALIEVNANLASERDALRDNLTATQERCTQLVEDLRAAKAELERMDRLRQVPLAPAPMGQRGIDFDCESCGLRQGSTLRDGWWRCNACGYPGK